jgi:hypothetical protein
MNESMDAIAASSVSTIGCSHLVYNEDDDDEDDDDDMAGKGAMIS